MMPAVRTVTATRYVTPLREGGSMPGLVEADDDGLYVLKFRGAGQGPKALAAELVAASGTRAALALAVGACACAALITGARRSTLAGVGPPSGDPGPPPPGAGGRTRSRR